jgi:hypothetical protein
MFSDSKEVLRELVDSREDLREAAANVKQPQARYKTLIHDLHDHLIHDKRIIRLTIDCEFP